MRNRWRAALGAMGLAGTALAVVLVARAIPADSGGVPEGPPYGLKLDPDSAVERLARAIRIRTVSRPPPAPPSDPSALLGFHRFLEEVFPRVHETLEVETVSGLSLLFTWPGTDPHLEPILLSAHLDVVPAPDLPGAPWTHPPFAGIVQDGHVWGRGVLDNKGPLMAILEAVDALVAQEFQPRRTVLLAFGHDEEVGGLAGAREIARLLEDRGLHPGWSLDEGLAIVDGLVPGLRGSAALVGTQEKGYMTVRILAAGEGGHSSSPPETTAIESLATAILRIDRLRHPIRMTGPTRELIEAIGPHLSFPMRLASENLWLLGWPVARLLATDPNLAGLVRTTGAVTVVDAGGVENRIPPTAQGLANFRIAPWSSPAEVLAWVEEAVADLPAIEILPRAGPPPIPPSRRSRADEAGFAQIRSAIHRSFPDVRVVAPALVPAATDGRHYESVARDTYRFAPFRADSTTLGRIHGIDERISIVGYMDMIRFYGELVRRAAES